MKNEPLINQNIQLSLWMSNQLGQVLVSYMREHTAASEMHRNSIPKMANSKI